MKITQFQRVQLNKFLSLPFFTFMVGHCNRLQSFLIISTVLGATMMLSCEKPHRVSDTHFTKADSLTETYLSLQDSTLQAWNRMINDDNNKLEAMQHILHELKVSRAVPAEQIESYQEQLRSLKSSRFTQKTMSNADVVDEYDFASASLVRELTALAESQRQFSYNSTLQKLVTQLRNADDGAIKYRNIYDAIAMRYNTFVEKNQRYLRESSPDIKPIFRTITE